MIDIKFKISSIKNEHDMNLRNLLCFAFMVKVGTYIFSSQMGTKQTSEPKNPVYELPW